MSAKASDKKQAQKDSEAETFEKTTAKLLKIMSGKKTDGAKKTAVESALRIFATFNKQIAN